MGYIDYSQDEGQVMAENPSFDKEYLKSDINSNIYDSSLSMQSDTLEPNPI